MCERIAAVMAGTREPRHEGFGRSRLRARLDIRVRATRPAALTVGRARGKIRFPSGVIQRLDALVRGIRTNDVSSWSHAFLSPEAFLAPALTKARFGEGLWTPSIVPIPAARRTIPQLAQRVSHLQSPRLRSILASTAIGVANGAEGWNIGRWHHRPAGGMPWR
jgi:hypothetical protein